MAPTGSIRAPAGTRSSLAILPFLSNFDKIFLFFQMAIKIANSALKSNRKYLGFIKGKLKNMMN